MEKREGITKVKLVMDEKANALITNEIGKGPFHILRDNYIQIYQYRKELHEKGIIN
ncbi:hypothetical protein ACFL0D_06810 [Thermoproteota archaeon]